MARNNPKPPEKLDWIPDDTTNILEPLPSVKATGWLFGQKPPNNSFNFITNLINRLLDYAMGQVEDWIVIDTDADEGDYATLVAYIADAPAAGDRILVKKDQTVTAQIVLPDNVTVKFLDGSSLLCATNIATSVLKLGSNPIIEGVLNIVLSQTGTTAKAVEIDGDNAVGKINVENSSTGTLTTGYHINANKTGNEIGGFIDNTGGGTLTNVYIDNSTKETNLLLIRDLINNNIIGSAASSIRNGLVELATSAETITGTDTERAVTPTGLQAKVSSTSAKGIVELATDAETQAGTDTERAITPAGLAFKLSLSTKVIDIGDWNMDTTQQKSVTHGLTLANIRTVEGMIRTNAGTLFAPITPAYSPSNDMDCNIKTIGGTTIILERKFGGNFDNTNYNQTSYNRGWLKITYVP